MWKKVKVSKLSIDSITLTKGDLHDIDEMVCDVTNDFLQDFMQENQTVFGVFRVQLQELIKRIFVIIMCTSSWVNEGLI